MSRRVGNLEIVKVKYMRDGTPLIEGRVVKVTKHGRNIGHYYTKNGKRLWVTL